MAVKKTKSTEVQRSLTKNGVKYGVSVSVDSEGKYFAHTHRARSKSYDSKDKIPVSVLKFIESTG